MYNESFSLPWIKLHFVTYGWNKDRTITPHYIPPCSWSGSEGPLISARPLLILWISLKDQIYYYVYYEWMRKSEERYGCSPVLHWDNIRLWGLQFTPDLIQLLSPAQAQVQDEQVAQHMVFANFTSISLHYKPVISQNNPCKLWEKATHRGSRWQVVVEWKQGNWDFRGGREKERKHFCSWGWLCPGSWGGVTSTTVRKKSDLSFR